MSVIGFTFLVLTVYLLALKGVSYFAYRASKKNTEDYFLSGRNVGVFSLIATTAASIFSTGTVVSAPSEFFKQGSGYMWILFFILLPLVMMPIALKFWKIAKEKSFITPGQLLGDFYKSKSVQIVAAIIGLSSMVPYAAAQMVAVGKTFDAITAGAVPYEVGVSIVTIAIGMYIWYGGSRAVIWTDTVQGIIFGSLLIATGFLVVNWAGGWSVMVDTLQTKHPEKSEFNVEMKYFEFVPLIMSFFFLPYVWQRAYMAKSCEKLAKTIAVIPFVFVILFFIAWVIGTSALTIFPDGLNDGDSVLGAVFNKHAPYFGALVLVAAFAAGMSTVDSQLLSAGSILTHDIKRKIIKRRVVAKLKWRDNYKFARIATMALLIAIYVWSLSLQDKSVFSLILLGISLNIVFFPAVYGMLYWNRSTATAATWSLGLGFLVLIIKGMTPFGEYFPTDLGGSSWALVVSIVVFIFVSLFTDSKELDQKRNEYRKILKV